MTVDKELGGFDIQLFSDVFANFDQVLAALTALAGFWFVAVFNARQMRWQGLAARARALGLGNGGTGLLAGLLDFGHKRSDVFVAGFLEQIPLHAGQRFALYAIANPAQMGQFQNEGLDFEVFGLKVFSIFLRLIHQRLNQRRHLCFGGSIEIQFIQLAQYFHGIILP